MHRDNDGSKPRLRRPPCVTAVHAGSGESAELSRRRSDGALRHFAHQLNRHGQRLFENADADVAPLPRGRGSGAEVQRRCRHHHGCA